MASKPSKRRNQESKQTKKIPDVNKDKLVEALTSLFMTEDDAPVDAFAATLLDLSKQTDNAPPSVAVSNSSGATEDDGGDFSEPAFEAKFPDDDESVSEFMCSFSEFVNNERTFTETELETFKTEVKRHHEIRSGTNQPMFGQQYMTEKTKDDKNAKRPTKLSPPPAPAPPQKSPTPSYPASPCRDATSLSPPGRPRRSARFSPPVATKSMPMPARPCRSVDQPPRRAVPNSPTSVRRQIPLPPERDPDISLLSPGGLKPSHRDTPRQARLKKELDAPASPAVCSRPKLGGTASRERHASRAAQGATVLPAPIKRYKERRASITRVPGTPRNRVRRRETPTEGSEAHPAPASRDHTEGLKTLFGHHKERNSDSKENRSHQDEISLALDAVFPTLSKNDDHVKTNGDQGDGKESNSEGHNSSASSSSKSSAREKRDPKHNMDKSSDDRSNGSSEKERQHCDALFASPSGRPPRRQHRSASMQHVPNHLLEEHRKATSGEPSNDGKTQRSSSVKRTTRATTSDGSIESSEEVARVRKTTRKPRASSMQHSSATQPSVNPTLSSSGHRTKGYCEQQPFLEESLCLEAVFPSLAEKKKLDNADAKRRVKDSRREQEQPNRQVRGDEKTDLNKLPRENRSPNRRTDQPSEGSDERKQVKHEPSLSPRSKPHRRKPRSASLEHSTSKLEHLPDITSDPAPSEKQQRRSLSMQHGTTKTSADVSVMSRKSSQSHVPSPRVAKEKLKKSSRQPRSSSIQHVDVSNEVSTDPHQVKKAERHSRKSSMDQACALKSLTGQDFRDALAGNNEEATAYTTDSKKPSRRPKAPHRSSSMQNIPISMTSEVSIASSDHSKDPVKKSRKPRSSSMQHTSDFCKNVMADNAAKSSNPSLRKTQSDPEPVDFFADFSQIDEPQPVDRKISRKQRAPKMDCALDAGDGFAVTSYVKPTHKTRAA